jgi:hypothetical protein
MPFMFKGRQHYLTYFLNNPVHNRFIGKETEAKG